MSRLSYFLAVVLLLTFAGNVAAHDMFVMPDKFRVAIGETVRIGFHSADGFPDSTSLPRRLRDASSYASNGTVPIAIKEDGKKMVGDLTISGTGHVLVSVINSANIEAMKPPSFLEYIKEEGLLHVVESRAQRGETDKPARERYTMFAKSILLAGQPNEGYRRALGLPIEIVPEKDPYSLKNGESLPVQVLFKGAPAAGLAMMAALAGEEAGKNQTVGKTDALGRIVIPVKAGKWRLHTIQMERASDSEADWESFWATLTFEIP